MFAAAATGVKVTVDGVTGAGEKSHWEYIGQYDGKDVKITGNNPDADMISMTRVSARVPESVYKKGGAAGVLVETFMLLLAILGAYAAIVVLVQRPAFTRVRARA